MAHLAPTWATIAPIVTHAIQKWEAVKENFQGYHWAMLATPEKVMKTPPGDQWEEPDALDEVAGPLGWREDDEPGPDQPQLGDQNRYGGDTRGDVEALSEPVEAGGAGLDGQPRLGVLLQVGVQPGEKADGDRIPREAPRMAATRSSRSAET